MAQQVINMLNIDTQSVSGDGQQMTFQLPRQYDVERYYLNFLMNFNVTVAATSIRNGGIWNYIRRIELILGGQTVIRSVTGATLAQLASYFHGYDLFSSSAWRSTPVVGTGAQQIAAVLPLDLAFPDMFRPKDSNLACSNLASVELRITMANTSDVFVGGTVASTGASCRVTADNTLELRNQKTGQISGPGYLSKITQIDVNTTTANSNLKVRLPIGNLLRAIFVTQSVNGDISAPATPLLNNMQIERGTDIRVNTPFALMRANYAKKALLAPSSSVFTGVVDFTHRGASQRGKVSDTFKVDGAMDLNAVLDFPATSGGILTLSVVEFIAASPRR